MNKFKPSLVLWLIAGGLIGSTSHAKTCQNFHDIEKAVLKGKAIHLVVNFSRCNSSTGKQPKEHYGAYTPQEVMIADNKVMASSLHFTQIGTALKPVYEYIRYVIHDDNQATISYQQLDAKDQSTISDQVTFDCPLNSGLQVTAD